MTKSLRLMTIVLLLGLTGCGGEGEDEREGAHQARKIAMQQVEERERLQAAEISRLRTELQETRIEMQREVQTRQRAVEERDQWKSRGIVAISIGAVLLFIGAGLGAGAMRDAKKQRS